MGRRRHGHTPSRAARGLAVTMAGAAFSLASPASGLGAVTIGSDLAAGSPFSSGCLTSATHLQLLLPGRPLTAPIDGVVVRYRLKTVGSPDVRLRVLRSAGGGKFTSVGASGAAAAVPGTNTFDARVPIAVGDYVAADQVTSGKPLGAFVTRFDALKDSFGPALGDGETRSLGGCESSGGSPREILFNADIELDNDRDGFGDETQDSDDDNDGLADVDEPARGTDPLKPDSDEDGFGDATDNCATQANSNQADRDTDGVGDTCDPLTPGACTNRQRGSGARDTITGTNAGDKLFGLAGNDVIRGLRGNDCLLGGAGGDRLDGGSGRDTLTGSSGADRLTGGEGADKLDGGRGKDSFSGGAGNDSVNSRDGRPEAVDCGRGRDNARADGGDRLRRCERATR